MSAKRRNLRNILGLAAAAVVLSAGIVGFRLADSDFFFRMNKSIDIFGRAAFARAEIYITDWSLTDDKSVKLRVCREVIETFHPELFKVIEDGITRHVEAMAAAKKARAGAGRPSAMSA